MAFRVGDRYKRAVQRRGAGPLAGGKFARGHKAGRGLDGPRCRVLAGGARWWLRRPCRDPVDPPLPNATEDDSDSCCSPRRASCLVPRPLALRQTRRGSSGGTL
ncbi:hypothetical protein KM043_006245 [Ampulex compressa]|nr:hypothetical protein KM043_006245 [Ampulex compressa]